MVGATRPPREFDPEVEDQEKAWKKWKMQYEWYAISSGIDKQEKEIQVASLMNAMGEKIIDIFTSLELTEEEKKDPAEIIKKFDAIFKKSDDSNYFRAKFFDLKQDPSQKLSDFIVQLKNAAGKCSFGDLESDMMLLQMQKGIFNEKLKEKLIGAKTLNDAKKICNDFEILEERRAKNQTIEVVKKGKSFKNTEKSIQNCKNCGRCHEKKNCPAFGKVCHKCKKKNHFARFCMSQKSELTSKHTENKNKVQQLSNMDSDVYFRLDSAIDQSSESDWYESIKIKNKQIKFKLDTGARCNVLPKRFCENLNVKLSPSPSKFIISYNNQRNPIVGEFTEKVTVESTGTSQQLTFIVVDIDSNPVLGKKSCVELNLIKRVHSIEWEDDIFNGLGCLKNYEYKIEFIDDPKFEIRSIRSLPYSRREEVKAELDKMVEMGVIEKVEEPTPVVSNVVLVEKEGKLRVCIDPSDINKAVKRRHFKMKSLDEIASKIEGNTWFTKLDLRKSYWQLAVHKDHRSI